MLMKKSEDWEDIEVKQRKADRPFFESNFIQQIYDGIDYLRDESREVLRELDIESRIDELDLEEFAENTMNQIDDILDDISRFKDSVIDKQDIPDDVRHHYRNTQEYFNRDADYLRRAKRKMARINAKDLADEHDTYERIIELCDKAIEIRPDSFDAYELKAQALVRLERYSEAIDEYVHALAMKDSVSIWLEIANLNRLNGNFDDALDVYDFVLDKYRRYADAKKGKARVYFDMGDYAECDNMFKQANNIETLDEASFKIWSECLEQLQKD